MVGDDGEIAHLLKVVDRPVPLGLGGRSTRATSGEVTGGRELGGETKLWGGMRGVRGGMRGVRGGMRGVRGGKRGVRGGMGRRNDVEILGDGVEILGDGVEILGDGAPLRASHQRGASARASSRPLRSSMRSPAAVPRPTPPGAGAALRWQ